MPVIEFEGAVVDEQAYLDGTREYMIEAQGEGDGGVWQLTLTLRWPKESDTPLEEGDLTLSDPAARDLFGALRDGVAEASVDEESGSDVVRLDLGFEPAAGEEAEMISGPIRVRGTLAGEDARLTVEF